MSQVYHSQYLDWIKPSNFKPGTTQKELDEMRHHAIAWAEVYPEFQPWFQAKFPDPMILPGKKCGRPKGDRNPYCLVTVSLYSGSASDWVKRAAKFSTASWMQECTYAFEQTGETDKDMGKNPHIHFCIRTDCLKSQVIEKSIASWKKYIFDNAKVDYKPHKDNSVVKYLQGDKTAKKMLKVSFDKKWRKKNYIKDIYINKYAQEKLFEEKVREDQKVPFEEAIQPKA